jgi:tetratricopeptide (TPR) repeat protein
MPREQPLTMRDLIRRRQTSGFIGRGDELRRFEANLDLPVDDPRRRVVFAVHGDAGIGKTFLLKQFLRIAEEHGYLTGYVDESVSDVPSAMEVFVGALEEHGWKGQDFHDRLATLRKRRHEPDSGPSEDAARAKRTGIRIAWRAVSDLPVVGAVAKEVEPDEAADAVDLVRRGLSRKRDDVDPVDVLTPLFLKNLVKVAEHRPVALFVDTYEQTGGFLDQWLRDVLEGRHGDVPSNLVLVIAGRSPLDANQWVDYLGVLADLPMAVFTEEEARRLLTERGVVDPQVADVVLELSGRLPVWVATLAEAHPQAVDDVGDPSESAVDRFLKWESDEVHRSTALHAALPRLLDADVFAVATGYPAEQFEWLRRQAFIRPQAQGFRYHDVVRSPMLRVLRRLSPQRWRELHEALAEHYEALREDLSSTGEASQRLAVEVAYHRLCALGLAALGPALAALVDVVGWQPDLISVAVASVAEGAQLSGDPEVLPVPRRLLELAAPDRVRWTPLLDALLANGLLDDEDRAVVLGERGELRALEGNHELALADFDTACTLAPDVNWLFAYRGNAYRRAGRFTEAMADFDRAVGASPSYHWCLAMRAKAHLALGNRAAAIADLTAAVEFLPDHVRYLLDRVEVYFQEGEYALALADCDRVASIDPKNGEVHRVRAYVHGPLQEYDRARVALDAALRLWPDDAEALSLRGAVSLRQGRIAEAKADLDRAVECDPADSWVVGRRGEFHLETGDPAAAEADLRRSVELDPANVWSLYLLEVALALREGRPAAMAGPRQACAERLAREPHDPYTAVSQVVILAVGGRPEARDLVLGSWKRHHLLEMVEDLEQAQRLLGFDAEPYLVALRQALG